MFLTRIAIRYLIILVFIAASVFHITTAQAQETIMFPARASDLPDEAYWNMGGDHGGTHSRDLNVVQHSGDGWTDLDANGGSENTDSLIFGIPLYAPEDGEVVSCWRKHPENPRPGSVDPGRCCGNNCSISCDDNKNCPAENACTITRSGNHVAIQKADGNVIVLSHLKFNSVPASICPHNASLMSDARNRAGDFPAESFLRLCKNNENPRQNNCVKKRPIVKQGEFIGNAGNSGASSGPHLHLQTTVVRDNNGVLEKVGNVKPTNIQFGWLKHRTDNSVWKPFRADAIRNPPVIVHASPYLRRADTSAGEVRHTDTLFLTGTRAVTASIMQSSGNMKLTSWDVVGLKKINRRDQFEVGAAKEVYLSKPLPNFLLAAVRQQDDKLKMIAFQVGPAGNLLRITDVSAGKISALDMTTTVGTNPRSITAVRDETGKLKLIAWDIQISNDKPPAIVRLGQVSAGAVSAISISNATHTDSVFTAVQDSTKKLKIIPWKLSSNGQHFTRGADASAGTIGTDFDVTRLTNGVAAAVQNAEGNLRIVTWSVNSNGDIGQRRSALNAGRASEITLLTSIHGHSNLTTVVRGNDSRLYLIGWKVNSDGQKLRRLGSSRAGAASFISADSTGISDQSGGYRDLILTSLRSTGGNLKLIAWDTNLIDP